MRKRIWICASLAAVLILASPQNTNGQFENCGRWVTCSSTVGIGQECTSVPTSAMPMTRDMWTPIVQDVSGGNCGTSSCWLIFTCPCGRPLATLLCQGEAGT
jgi:hypothetical protein